jgi:hypothetical protein
LSRTLEARQRSLSRVISLPTAVLLLLAPLAAAGSTESALAAQEAPAGAGESPPAQDGEAEEPGSENEPAAGQQPAPASASARAYLIPDDQPGDYPLKNGHFYSQTVPKAPRGYGFSIADAAGVPLWREYQRLGGLEKLGYPVSRRFIWGESVAQAVQAGLLRWRSERRRADLVPWDRFGELPSEAVEPEPPARLGATAARQPWSGWWWPATTSVRGPHLFDSTGPLAKYDRFVARNGADDPRTMEWEREELRLDVSWAGHCNGWAAAALLEREPTQGREAGGISFGVADLKGLLSAYHFADSAAWLRGGDDLSPVEFHQQLVEWLGLGKKGLILTFKPSSDEEVWSYPAFRFELTMSPDPVESDTTHVQATVWLADNEVAAEFVGLQLWRGEGQSFEYTLIGPRDEPTGGEWQGASVSGRFAHPSSIWYPDPKHRNIDRALASPNLDYKTIKKILGRK